MTPNFRILEISLYALMNFLPYLGLTIYIFYNFPRFKQPVTVLICILSVIAQISSRFWGALSSSGNTLSIILLRFIIYTFLMALAIKVRLGKILFVELIFSNISSFVMIAATCLQGLFFSRQTHPLFCWHASLIIFILHFFITLPFSLIVGKRLKKMLETETKGIEWTYFWIIPATFYLTWQFILYGDGQGYLANMSNPGNVIFLFITNVGALFVYHVVIQLCSEFSQNLELQKQQHVLEVEMLEYQILEERIEEARRARHDMRHHMIVMSNFLENEDYKNLQLYLNDYHQSLPNEQAIVFCSNMAVNSLLLYFANVAHEHEIDFQVNVSLPDKLTIPDTDLTVLLGNLLENAINACIEQSSEQRKIIVHGKADHHSVSFTIDNTCDNKIKKTPKGHFLSTLKGGSGLGLSSAEHIVNRYGGVFSAEKKGNMFYVSFLLNLDL